MTYILPTNCLHKIKSFIDFLVDLFQETMEETGSESASGDHEKSSKRRRRYNQKRRTVVNPDENFHFYWLMVLTICVLYNLWTLIVRQSFPELQVCGPNNDYYWIHLMNHKGRTLEKLKWSNFGQPPRNWWFQLELFHFCSNFIWNSIWRQSWHSNGKKSPMHEFSISTVSVSLIFTSFHIINLSRNVFTEYWFTSNDELLTQNTINDFHNSGNSDKCEIRSTRQKVQSIWNRMTFDIYKSDSSTLLNMLKMYCDWRVLFLSDVIDELFLAFWRHCVLFSLLIFLSGAGGAFLVRLRQPHWCDIYMRYHCTATNWISGTRSYGKYFPKRFRSLFFSRNNALWTWPTRTHAPTCTSTIADVWLNLFNRPIFSYILPLSTRAVMCWKLI